MKTILLSLVILFSSTVFAQNRQYYQLKIYSFENEAQQNAADSFLEKTYLPALKRHKITNTGVFKPREIDSSGIKKTYVLTAYNSLHQFEALDSLLLNDPIYLKSGRSFLDLPYDSLPYIRVSSILLKAFEKHPILTPTKLEGSRTDRVYELRSYESATEKIYRNKVAMFNAGGEVALFDKLNFNPIFYGEVLSGDQMPNLMYMTTFENQESRDAHWKKFGDSPEWNAMKTLPKYQNNVSHMDITFLYPTSYSDY